ncbi:MAG: hypothetical protein ACEPOV_00965 [Hyphomicrobiales bacterium]
MNQKVAIKGLVFLLFFVLTSTMGFAAKYSFNFVFGVGSPKTEKALVFYQLIEKSGNALDKIPVSIENGESITIRIRKRKIKAVKFSGYFLNSDNKTRKSILTVSKNVESLIKRGKGNIVTISAATEIAEDFSSIADIMTELSEKRYVDILNKSKKPGYSQSNVYPVGKFILYDPDNNISKDVLTFDAKSSYFIESSKSIYDEYLLRKEAGASVNLRYRKLNSIESSSGKTQYIKFIVKIDTIQIIHWQSKVSEMEFLYDKAQAGRLRYLFTELKRNPKAKLYFISSCMKIKDFTLFSQVGDSIGTVQDVNLSLPSGASNISVKSGVVYSSSEGKKSINKTSIFYTGFGVRDYTLFARGLLNELDINEQLKIADDELAEAELEIKSLFKDIQKVDTNIIDFDSPEIIVHFFEDLNEKIMLPIADSLDITEKQRRVKANMNASYFNAALISLKEKIDIYKEKKEYLDLIKLEQYARREGGNQRFVLPKETKIESEIIEQTL